MNVRDEMISAGMLRPGTGVYVPRDQPLTTVRLPDGTAVVRLDAAGRAAAARELAGGKSRGTRDLNRATHELATLQRWR